MYSPSLRLSSPWRQPPPGSRPRINRAHPLATDLIFAVLGSHGGYDLTDYIRPTFVGGNIFRGNGLGVALVGQSATNNFTHWGSPTKYDFTQATSITTFSVFSVESGDGTARMFPATRDTGVGGRTLFQWTLTTSNFLRIVFGSAAAVLGFTDGTTALTAASTVVHTGAGVRDVAADQVRVYTDGVLESEIADASTGAWTVAGTVGSGLISNPASTASFCSLMAHLVDLVWTRALTSAEIGYLHQNPYALFEWDEPDPLTALIPGLVTEALAGFSIQIPFEALFTPVLELLVAPTTCSRAMTPVEGVVPAVADPTTLAIQGVQGTPASLEALAKPSLCGRAMTSAPPLGFGFTIEPPDPEPVTPVPTPFGHHPMIVWQGTTYSSFEGEPYVDGLLVTPPTSAQNPSEWGGTGYWIFLGSSFLDDDDFLGNLFLWGGDAPLAVELRGFDGDPPDGRYTEPFYYTAVIR